MGSRSLTGVERFFRDDEIIVSKTDLAGKITYCNSVFWKISGYREDELIGQPHSILRHPRMPRVVFKLLWERIAAGKEIFAFVLNRTKPGDEYWVFAHVTPTFSGGQIVGYHSNRRTVNRAALPQVRKIYDRLLTEEARYPQKLEGITASQGVLAGMLHDLGTDYDRLVWSLETHSQAVAS